MVRPSASVGRSSRNSSAWRRSAAAPCAIASLAVSKNVSQPGLGPDQADSLISRVQAHDEGPDWRLVHRLDRDTSGVLLLAAGLEALRRTSALFSNRSVNKLYLAHVRGVLAGRGCIHNRLARLQRENELKALLETSSNFKVSFESVRFDLLLETNWEI